MKFRLTKQQRQQTARKTSTSLNVPPPLGGLNTRDSLGAMPATDAIQLINLIPQQNGLISRKGHTENTTGYSSFVETIAPYVQGTADFLITASGTTLYKDDGTVTSLATGLTNARWNYTKLGANMLLVNGADAPRNFDGTTLTTPSLTGDIATFGTTNIDIIHKHNNRIYMASTKDGSFFYGGVNSVSGAFTKFQLDRVSDTGGNMVAIKSISQNAANGVNDYIAFILNTGEVVIYQGSDPSDAANWSLVGKYRTPPIIGRNCAIEFGGDVFIVTKQDLIKLSDVIKYTSDSGGFNLQPSKLSGAITNDYLLYGSNWGWSINIYPKGGWIIINVPEVTNSVYSQYVVNLVTGAGTKFYGWNASSFGILNDNLYFGGSTKTYLADNGLSDNGSDIQLTARQAFSNLGISNKKKMNNMQLFVSSEGSLSISVGVSYDFGLVNLQATQASQSQGSSWDTSDWDISDWAGNVSRTINYIVGGIGAYVSPQLSLQIQNQQINWYATTYSFNASDQF